MECGGVMVDDGWWSDDHRIMIMNDDGNDR